MSPKNEIPLQALASPELAAMHKRLEEMNCVMEFEVYAFRSGEFISRELHRQALELFFAGVRERSIQQRLSVIKEFPKYASSAFFMLEVDFSAATSIRLSEDRVMQLVAQRENLPDAQCLFRAFSDPPHGMKISQAEAPHLFQTWCELMGLSPKDDIKVLDWVGDPNQEPQRSDWSNYFSAGKEWWGIWCLTILNPLKRTISVLAASATD